MFFNLKAMLAGEEYDCLDPQLIALRHDAQTWLQRFNQTVDTDARYALLKGFLGAVGVNSMIESPFFCSYGTHLRLGTRVFINGGCHILDNNTVDIGDFVMIGPAVQLYTAAHALDAAARIAGRETAKPIVIEEKVWIGGGAIVLPGVRIGRCAVVGAGAVVTRAVAPYTVVAGNPARVIKTLTPSQ